MNDSFPQLRTHTESSKLSYSSLVIKHKIASGLTADIYLSSLADSQSDDEYVLKIFHRKSDKFYMLYGREINYFTLFYNTFYRKIIYLNNLLSQIFF